MSELAFVSTRSRRSFFDSISVNAESVLLSLKPRSFVLVAVRVQEPASSVHQIVEPFAIVSARPLNKAVKARE